jgi:hypothetical protein
MFCALRLVFVGAECVRFRFRVLHARTRFRRYRGRQVPFSCFALLDSFSAVPRASCTVFMFNAHKHIFGGSEGVVSLFLVVRSRTSFRPYRGCRVPLSSFAHPKSFSTVPRLSGPFFMFSLPNSFSTKTRASGPFFMFCPPGLIFGGTEGVGFRFHFLCPWTRFRRYRGRRVPFSCFARPDSFSAVPRASSPVFMFYAPGLVFGCIEGVGARFHVLYSQTRFRRYRGRQIPFSYFALPDSFWAVPRASGPVFMFCGPRIIFSAAESVGSRFHVLRSRNRYRR